MKGILTKNEFRQLGKTYARSRSTPSLRQLAPNANARIMNDGARPFAFGVESPPNRQLPVVHYPYSAVAFAESRNSLGNSIYSAGWQD
jgi:hypothetical protein